MSKTDYIKYFGYTQPKFISHLLIGLSPCTFLEDGRLLSEIKLNFLVDFISDELEDEVDNDDMVVIREKALKFDAFVEQRWKAIGDQLAKVHLIVTCPRCLQDAAELSDGLHCLFCRYKNDDPEDVTNEFVSEFLCESKYEVVTQGGEWPIYSCPGCDCETLIGTDEGYICFSCAERWEFDDIDECTRCGALCFTEEGSARLYDYCLEDVLSE